MGEYYKGTSPYAKSLDFLNMERRQALMSGFAQSSSWVYIIFRVFMFVTLLYMVACQILACILQPEKEILLDGAHFLLSTIFVIFGLASRMLSHRSLARTTEIMKSGIYVYENEDHEDPEATKLKDSIPKEIYAKSNVLMIMYIVGALSASILLPISHVLLDYSAMKTSGVVNPYLPHLSYQPFNTRTPVGFMLGTFLGFLYFYCLNGAVVGFIWTYFNCAVQLKNVGWDFDKETIKLQLTCWMGLIDVSTTMVDLIRTVKEKKKFHLRLLNLSIKNIQKRALILYYKEGYSGSQDDPDLLGRQEYQRCLFLCLKSNIQHHQALIRLKKAFQTFVGAYLLDILAASSIVFGLELYVLNQRPPVVAIISRMAEFLAEQFTILWICSMGEDVITESQKVFNRMYRISWFDYGKRFNQLLHIMMSNTLKPMTLDALLIGVPVSLEIYGEIVSVMYKILTIARQSDAV